MESLSILLQIPNIIASDTLAVMAATDAAIGDTVHLVIALFDDSTKNPESNWIKDYLPVLLLFIGAVITYYFNIRLEDKKLKHNKELEYEKLRLNKELESERLKFQQKHLKFTTFYNKQFEVLNEADKLIGASVRNAKELEKILKFPFNNNQDFDQYEQDQDQQWMKDYEYMERFQQRSIGIESTLRINTHALLSLIEDNPRFIDKDLVRIGTTINIKLEEILDKDYRYTTPDIDDHPCIHKESLEKTLKENIAEIEKFQKEFNSSNGSNTGQ